MSGITTLIIVATVMFCVLGGITLLAYVYNLNNIKSKTVGDGQHGTARWANKGEIRKTYKHVPFTPKRWRKQAKHNETPTDENGNALPQGIVVGCTGNTTAMIDTGDVHVLMIGAAGVGKTAFGCTHVLSMPAPRACLFSPPTPRVMSCETMETLLKIMATKYP